MIIFLALGLLLGGLTVIFALQNVTPITVTFLAWQIEGSLAVVLILAVLSGMLISSLFSLPGLIKKSFQISRLRKNNNKLKDELITKEKEVESEKAKVVANNAYLDDLEKNPRI
jgi:uncharacterized integral membrane protein